MSEARVDDIARKIVGVANANLRPPESHITFEVEPCSIVIPSRAVAILALVLNEMVSNAIKHGMTGKAEGIVTICGREEDGMVIVKVLDTGNGPPELFEEDSSEGLGLSLIRNLMGDIGGQFMLRRTYEKPPRTCAEVHFPLARSPLQPLYQRYLAGFLLCFQRVPTLDAVTISSLVPGATIGAGIEQRTTASTEINIGFIWTFTFGA